MTISAAIKDASRVYFNRFGATVKFLVVKGCMTLAALTPLLFLADDQLKTAVLLVIPFWMLLIFWARVNAAAAMRDALNGGSLFTRRLVETEGYGRKLAYGLKRLLLLLLWGAPLIACLVVARIHYYGDMDVMTLMRGIKNFGGGDLTTGMLYLALILVGSIIVLVLGCAFHSGDRHAFVRNNQKLVKKHKGRIVLCWFSSLFTLLPMIIAIVAVIIRYLPALKDLSAIMSKQMSLPSTKVTLIILGVGAVLTVPLLPLRSLIPAAFVNGLEKE